MKGNTARFLSLVAVAAMGLGACVPLAAAPETQSAESPVETASPVVETEAPTTEAQLELTGTVEQIAPGAWTVNGKVLAILPATQIRGSFRVGDMVKAHAAVQADGSLAALEIDPVEIADPASLPGSEYDFTGAIDAMSVDQWTVAGTTFAVTPATEIKGAFAIGDLVKVHLLVGSDLALVAREIEAPEAELEKAGEGAEVELVALIDSISPEAWVVGGQTLAITPETEIKGTFAVGDAVKVHIVVGPGGALAAREIEAAEVGEVGGVDDDNTNGNANANANSNANANDNGNDNGGGGNGNDNGGGGGGNDNGGGGNSNSG
jgi:uncharacterized membrane protein YgcG